MKEKLKAIQEKAMAAFQEAKEMKDIDDLKVKYLGKKGELTAILKEMGKLSAEERPIIGQMANDVRQNLEKMLDEAKVRLAAAEMAHRLEKEKIDVTMPGRARAEGHKHPMSIVTDEICSIFMGMGYEVAEGPEVEKDYYNFEALNIPKNHPARDEQDTFYIGGDILKNPNNVRLYANSSSSLSLESNITGQIERILEAEKLKAYNIENLSQILDEVKTSVNMQTFRNDKSQEEDTQAQSSAVATGVGYVLGFILYMFLLIYGSMVMQSVIEEKNNRVLEVMVSSVRPFDLMMGKILGVASVAIVQVLLWGVLIAGVGALVMPHLMPEDVMASAQAMQQGMPDAASMSGMNPEMLQAVAAMTDLGYIVKIFVSLLLFVFGGYLLYSAMFAAVGSAVDNVQDASQLQMPITLPIILALLMMFVVIKDPNSQLAFWFSIIPFTSPIVMMARIPYDIPLWEVALSLVVLYASFVGMVWFAAKIYRVGIFMYGKKPSLKELFKWIRYKY